MPMNPERTTRRRLVKTAAAISTVLSIAGCSGDDESNSPDADETDDDPDPELRINGRYLSSAFPIEFVDPGFEETTGFGGDARIVYIHWHGREHSHWHQSPLEIAVGETRSGRTRFLKAGAEEVPLGPDAKFSQQVHPTEETSEDLVTTTVDGAFVDIEAGRPGDGELVFELWGEEDRRWRSPPLPVEVR